MMGASKRSFFFAFVFFSFLFSLGFGSAAWESLGDQPHDSETWFQQKWSELTTEDISLAEGSPGTCYNVDKGFNVFQNEVIDGTTRCIVNGVTQDCNGGAISTYFDSCRNLEKDLIENFCGWDGRITSWAYDCPLGCFNGACRTLTCTDTDGGIDFNVNGTVQIPSFTVTKYRQMSSYYLDVEPYDLMMGGSYQDYCDGETLVEYSCGVDNLTVTRQPCVRGCDNGACMPYELAPVSGGDALGEGSPDEIPEEWCLGCFSTETQKCYPLAAKFIESGTDYYCSSSANIAPQKLFEASCVEDYECLSNVCLDGACQDLDTILEDLNFFTKAWARLVCILTTTGNPSETVEECMVNRFHRNP